MPSLSAAATGLHLEYEEQKSNLYSGDHCGHSYHNPPGCDKRPSEYALSRLAYGAYRVVDRGMRPSAIREVMERMPLTHEGEDKEHARQNRIYYSNFQGYVKDQLFEDWSVGTSRKVLTVVETLVE